MSMRGASKKTGEFRPEIQALRAVAVVAVVVFHVWPDALPGGFVGVDVFFAISGFLITSHLLREVDRRGRLSLPAFWARRARRLLPASLLVILVGALGTLALVPLNHWEQFLAELRASTLYVQNWELASSAVDYFAQDNIDSPVQHYWSLSAEEQFYLVWPVLIAGAIAAAAWLGARRRETTVASRRRAIAVVLGAVTVASLAYSVWQTEANPGAAYFVTPTRAWEFGAGGLLALVAGGFARIPSPLRSLLSYGGLAAIVVTCATYSIDTPFPGYAALLPILGTLAVIAAQTPEGRFSPAPALRLRPAQFCGDISYSVYLWHWPLLVLAPFALDHELGTRGRIGVVVATVLAAWLTKILVEDPVRFTPLLTRRRARYTFSLAAAGMVLLVALTLTGTSHVEAQLRASTKASDALIAQRPRCFGAAARDPQHPCTNPKLARKVVPTPIEARKRRDAPCEFVARIAGKRYCEFGVPASQARATIALVGDSHAGHWLDAFDEASKARGWRGLLIGHASCPLSTAVRAIPEPGRSSCLRWRRALLGWFKRHPDINTIFVSQLTGGSGVEPRPGLSQFETAVRGYQAAWRKLPRSIGRVVVIRDTPKADGDTDDCVQRVIDARQRGAAKRCAVDRRANLDPDPAAVAARRMHSKKVRLVDMTRFFCDRTRCYPVIGGALVWKDSTHMTGVWSATLGPYLLRRIGAYVPARDGEATVSSADAGGGAVLPPAFVSLLSFALRALGLRA